MTTTRRHFLLGLGSLLAAPAIVRAGALMPASINRLEVDRWMVITPSMWGRSPGMVDLPDVRVLQGMTRGVLNGFTWKSA